MNTVDDENSVVESQYVPKPAFGMRTTSSGSRLTFGRQTVIFGSTIVLVLFTFFAIGYAIEMYHHQQTMRAIREYAQTCADANEPVEVAGVIKCIQGNASRTAMRTKFGPDTYVWKVFGLIETHLHLSVEEKYQVSIEQDSKTPWKHVIKVNEEPI